ncbi:hypothetical protein EPUS_00775 [Endocarpon pusillum Z07020]|uniref:Uncharacterized protein n=1 Tax=Endocarpon pusillum (strain Z07020 / HMAS-L-300199) TaxID=1263415 RepID=U1HVE5_ENDPU|nr:uncharacterized protein EPUS_00775 [Endocarpon pusillum Z07020]ERF74645.1 hypothetical protein EPUS_00775 [Endocarpon pusillum Z07020]
MSNPYPFLGDPQEVDILGFTPESKKAMYSFTTNGTVSTMISAPSTDDLFHSSNAEAKEDGDKDISDLLFQAAKDDIPPSVTRVKTAYGFDKPGIDGLAFLRMYRSLFEQHGIHPTLLDRWRTSASMQRNILKTTPINPKLLSVLQDLDADMKGSSNRWLKYEQLLRSRMRKPYPACINCGGKGNGNKLLQCGGCLNV